MPAERKCVPAVRTIRLRLAPEANGGKRAPLPATTAVWDRAVGFYIDLLLNHPGAFDQRETEVDPKTGEPREKPWDDEDRTSWTESDHGGTPGHRAEP